MGSPHQLGAGRLAALDRMDALPRDIRQVAHEIGLPIVEALMQAGVRQPRHMRHIANLFWTAAGGESESRVGVKRHLDVMLLRAGGCPNAASLARLMAQNQVALVPMSPSPRMVQASLDEVGRHGIVSKTEKHRLRLRAAIAAGCAEMWPEVFGDG